MIDIIADMLASSSKELAVFVLAAMPVSELRGAIPMGIAFGIPPVKTFLVAFAGNMLPVIPLLFLFHPISERLRKIPVFSRFFDWLENRTRKKSDLIERFEAIGLMLFVAVPLPMTGAWTGCIAATLFRIHFRYAFPAVTAGVAIAGIVITLLSLAGKGLLGR
ncbi:MAG: small multi-drug export protein [Candidatus Omnitrophica bacterium]|nr:small multi-drug export protein [Candidatus Omnitrophota bacterium]MDD4012676.1 small multi-drug export protein [Candidatus Omnitrophota bacterium]